MAPNDAARKPRAASRGRAASKPRSASPARARSASKPRAAASPAPAAKQRDTPAAKPEALPAAKPKAKQHKAGAFVEYEFGGPVGAASIMLISHALLYYVYFVLTERGGSLWLPSSGAELAGALRTLARTAAPTWRAAGLYFGFLGVEGLFALVMPGLMLTGRADEMGRVLQYNCNSYASWWASLLIGAALQYSGVFSFSAYVHNWGPVMTVAVIFANLQSLAWYLYAHYAGLTHRMSGNAVYDFFMGAILHPRLFGGRLDIKMFAEVRLSWYLLFMLVASCAVARYEEHGAVGYPLLYLCLAIFLYANACSKGEHYIPPTWDITYEKYGWMLCFWNFAGVPFLYVKSAFYLYKYGTSTPGLEANALFYGAGTVLLLLAYYVWDTSQSQKNHFRLEYAGTVVERWTFPKLPWATIPKARHIKTAKGTPLLVDGWWAYARKIHYTADIWMASSWALCTGFGASLPYIYPVFFVSMLIHRYFRDMHKCARVYGADWVAYCKAVPYAFIPGVI